MPFSMRGARVIGVSRSIKDSDFEHPAFVALPAELSSGDAARALASKCGRIDALIHLMGAFAGAQSVAESDDATLDRMFDLNFRSTFHKIRAVLPAMRAQGGAGIVAIR